MPHSSLTAKLHAHLTLLPSQRELLERVIFQLEFNGFQHTHLVGKAGSGKTTLSLVLAELLSDQMNLAYFNAQPGMTPQDCQQQLLQQWFGLTPKESSLLEQLEQTDNQALVWVVDSQGELPQACLSLLRAHPIHIITTGPEVVTEADVNLVIPAITAEDAQLLLAPSAMSAWSVQDRLEHAANNLHRLLDGDLATSEVEQAMVVPTSGRSAKRYRLASLALAVMGAVVIIVHWVKNPHHDLQDVTSVKVDNQPAERFRAPALHQQAALPRTEPSIEQVDEEGKNRVAVLPSNEIEWVVMPESEAMRVVHVDPQRHQRQSSNEQSESSFENEASLSLPAISYSRQETELLAMDGSYLSLQLGAFSSEPIAQRLVSRYPELDLYLFQRKLGSQLQWVVVIAPFNDAESARQKRNQLNEVLRAEVPFVKPLSAIHQEIQLRETVRSDEL